MPANHGSCAQASGRRCGELVADFLGVAREGHVPGTLEQRGREDAEHQQRKEVEERARSRAEVDVERVDAHMPARDEHVRHRPAGPHREQERGDLVGPGEDEAGAQDGADALAQQHLGGDDGRGRKEHCAAHPNRDASDRGDGGPKHAHQMQSGPGRSCCSGPTPTLLAQSALAVRPYFLPTDLGPLGGAGIAAALGPGSSARRR